MAWTLIHKENNVDLGIGKRTKDVLVRGHLGLRWHSSLEMVIYFGGALLSADHHDGQQAFQVPENILVF